MKETNESLVRTKYVFQTRDMQTIQRFSNLRRDHFRINTHFKIKKKTRILNDGRLIAYFKRKNCYTRYYIINVLRQKMMPLFWY